MSNYNTNTNEVQTSKTSNGGNKFLLKFAGSVCPVSILSYVTFNADIIIFTPALLVVLFVNLLVLSFVAAD